MVRPVVSQMAEDLYAELGAWSDQDGDDSGWVLLHLCEALVGPLQPVRDWSSDTDDAPGWAWLMSADTTPVEWLPWLGQFVGVKVDTYQSEANQRAQVKDESGFTRGTVAHFLAQLRRYLQGTQRIDLHERDTSAYHFRVDVWRGELAGLHYSTLDAMYPTYAAMDAAYATYADMNNTNDAALTAAAVAAKPAGLVMNLVINPGLPA
jgi:hypothetical protein